MQFKSNGLNKIKILLILMKPCLHVKAPNKVHLHYKIQKQKNTSMFQL
jgi:hypothetical protein